MKLLLAKINYKKIWKYDESKNILMRKGLDYPINLIIISLLYGIVALLLISRIFLVFLRWQQIIMGGGGTKAWDDKWALCYLADRRVPLKSEPAQSKDSEPNIKKVPRKSRCKDGGHQSLLISKTLSTTACQLSRNFPFTKPNLDLTIHKYRYWARSQTAQDHNGSGQAQDYMFYSPPFIAHTSTIIQWKPMAMSGICEPFTNKQGTHY